MSTTSPPVLPQPENSAPPVEEGTSNGALVFATLYRTLIGVVVCLGLAELWVFRLKETPSPAAFYGASLWRAAVLFVLGAAVVSIGRRASSRLWLLGPVVIGCGAVWMLVNTVEYQGAQRERAEAVDFLDELPLPDDFVRGRVTEDPWIIDGTAGSESGWVGFVTLDLDSELSRRRVAARLDEVLVDNGAERVRGECRGAVHYEVGDGKRVVIRSEPIAITVIYEKAAPPRHDITPIFDPNQVC